MKAKKQSGNVPMTNIDAAMAILDEKYGHSVNWVQLENGRIMRTGKGFSYSDDGGLTWSETFLGKDENGNDLSGGSSLVNLSNGAVGMAYTTPAPDGISAYDKAALFRCSEDQGKTWSAPIQINSHGPSVHALQDVLLKTSSGRIIYPTYMGIGQGNFHLETAPFCGGYVNGNFVSTDAHFFDPHFSAAVVFYSDDDGKTWQRNGDGEIFILCGDVDNFQYASEPSIVEVSENKLLMMMRTGLGRYFQSWSYNNGETWSRPKPTQLAGTNAPCQLRKFKNSDHLLCVFTQQSEEEVRKGFIRTRLSSAISRNGGGCWEHFQNVESLHEETHVEPGPIRHTYPEQRISMGELPAPENDSVYVVPLPIGYGRWSYPSVLVLEDRVLISHSFSWHDENGEQVNGGGSKLKVLPISWFYDGGDPVRENTVINKLTELAPEP